MNAREERGLVIAALCKLNRSGGSRWLVPSQSGESAMYTVDTSAQTCTCLDHVEGGQKCKHLYAAEFTMKREYHRDGTVTETKTVTFTEKVTYKQDWPAYTKAQTREKGRFQELLRDLLQTVEEPKHQGVGRMPHARRDVLFALVFKIYGTLSSRRSDCDMVDAEDRGFIRKAMPHQKLSKYMRDESLTPILKTLIARSAAPLKAVETDFAIDSSGFGTSRFERWYDEKYGVTRTKCLWVKTHIACGVKTNIVTAVRILDKDAADSPQFIPLITETRRTFVISEVSADKAYTSLENFEAVAGMGGTAYLPFKTNATGSIGGLFQKMFHYFQFKQEEYLAHYHKRSNVESTFSMIKRKFGDSVRSKDDVSMVNEVLCKILAHNLCVLNHAECDLGIETLFPASVEQTALAS